MVYLKDFEIVQGDTLTFTVEINGINGNLKNAYFSVKKNINDTSYVFQKTLSGNNQIVKVDNNHYRVRIAPNDTKNLDTGSYFYDMQIGINDDVWTILSGRLKVTYQVTTES